jgi:hypothetical protein
MEVKSLHPAMSIGDEIMGEKVTYHELKDKNFIGVYDRMMKVGSR